MGVFSWMTSDTKKSISICGSSRGPLPVYLVTPDNKFIFEPEYQGYGIFGGYDAYCLLAKWNAPEQCVGDYETRDAEIHEEDRHLGIELALSGKPLKYPLKFAENKIPYDRLEASSTCPDQGLFYSDSDSFDDEEDEEDEGIPVKQAINRIHLPEGLNAETLLAVDTIGKLCSWEVLVNDKGGVFTLTFGFCYFGEDCEEKCSFKYCPNNLHELVEAVYKTYQDYNPDYETYARLDSSGHGTGDSPYLMCHVLEEKEMIKKGLQGLWNALEEFELGHYEPKEFPDGFTKDDLSLISGIANYGLLHAGFKFEWRHLAESFCFTYEGDMKSELVYPTASVKSWDDLACEVKKSLDAVKPLQDTLARMSLETAELANPVLRHLNDYVEDLSQLHSRFEQVAKRVKASK